MTAIGWMLVAGHKSSAEMDTLTATADIGNFTRQADQIPGRDWMRPDNASDIYEQEGALIDDVTGGRDGYGGDEYTWKMRILSSLMTAYLETQVFAGRRSAAVTTRGPDRATGTTVTKNAIARYHRRSEHGPEAGGFDLYVIDFVDGVDAPDGPDAAIAVSHAGDFTIGLSGVWSVAVTNSGDGATFDDIQVDASIPAGVTLSSLSGTDWTFEYSDDGGSNYSPTPPSPITNTTDIRATYSNVLSPGEVAPVISVTVNVVSGSSTTLTATVSTTGDTSAGNDSDSDLTTIAGSPFTSGFSTGFGQGDT